MIGQKYISYFTINCCFPLQKTSWIPTVDKNIKLLFPAWSSMIKNVCNDLYLITNGQFTQLESVKAEHLKLLLLHLHSLVDT